VYASFSNHLDQGLHYALAFAVLFWLWPKLLFRRVEGDAAERAAANYILMVLTLIGLGYLLIVTKLLELLTLVAIFGLWALYRWARGVSNEKRTEMLSAVATLALDYFEKKFSLRELARSWVVKQSDEVKREWRQRVGFSGALVETALLLAVMAGAIYVRFYDAVVYSVPGMSDGNVTLLWMKLVDKKLLFEEGIYPQGFHIYLDMLFKFSFIDGLYIQKYTGPFNSILALLGLHFIVSRLTGSRLAGVAAAFVFGWLGALTGNGWERQAATNSQEFAMVFVFPALYFYHRYFLTGVRQYLLIGTAGVLITGLVHTLVFGFLVMAVAILAFVHWIGGIRKMTAPTLLVIATGAAAGVLSLVPIGAGLLLGKEFQSSSQDFLTSQIAGRPSFPLLHPLDRAAVGAAALLTVGGLAAWRKPAVRPALLFGGLFTAVAFLLYYAGGYLTRSTVIASRAGDLWAYVLPFAIGMALGAAAAPLSRFRPARAALPVLLAGAMAFSLVRYPLEPIVPYKMQAEAQVEQYLRISEIHRPKTWILFHQSESYALVEGVGIHNYIGNFLKWYDPRHKYLTRYGEREPDRDIPNDAYVFFEKKVYRVGKDVGIYVLMEAEYERREREMKELARWIEAYEKANGPIEIFYEDDALRVYRFHRPLTRDEVMEQIWNSGGKGE